jgi:hypothetical protein
VLLDYALSLSLTSLLKSLASLGTPAGCGTRDWFVDDGISSCTLFIANFYQIFFASHLPFYQIFARPK